VRFGSSDGSERGDETFQAAVTTLGTCFIAIISMYGWHIACHRWFGSHCGECEIYCPCSWYL